MQLKPFTHYECASGNVGLGHSSHWTGAYLHPSDKDENCICGQPLAEVVPDGYRYKVTFESISPFVAAEMEARHGRDVWSRLSSAEWDALKWHPVTSEQGTPNTLRDQYKRLLAWSQSHEQPIRNVRFFRAQDSEWTQAA